MRSPRPTVLASMLAGLALVASACTLTVAPGDTDPLIDDGPGPHRVHVDPSVPATGELFVFLPGTGATPDRYDGVLAAAAAQGMWAIGLAYPNAESVNFDLCRGSADPDCSVDVRTEIVYGIDRSPLVDVSPANSIEHRLVALLEHLGWQQFLLDGQPRWDRIVVSGHSQGGGHAALIARDHEVARAVFYASPGDWFEGAPAPWLLEPWATPTDRLYGFAHVDDFAVFPIIWAAIGVPGPPVVVDDASPPFDGGHRLLTELSSSNPHSTIVVDELVPLDGEGTPVYAPVWTYLCCS